MSHTEAIMAIVDELPLKIRCARKDDLPEIMSIEAFSPKPKTQKEVLRLLRDGHVGYVAEVGSVVAGYVIYNPLKTRIVVSAMAVCPLYRREGLGTKLMSIVIGQLSPEKRTSILVDVHERSLDMQLFLKQLGFQAKSIFKEYYGPGEDAYQMRLAIKQEAC